MHDNYALNWAVNQAKSANSEIIPVYCFDPRYFNVETAKTKYNTIKTGPVRAQFYLESVQSLRSKLKEFGSNLLVSLDRPENFIP